VRERVLAAGALAYLVKPMDGPTVARCIAAALDGGDPAADPYTLV